MSKAFTREDDISQEPILTRMPTALPPGVKNYITVEGAKNLRRELENLTQTERPSLLASLDADAVKRELQMLDQKIAILRVSLASAEIVEPPTASDDVVRFGASVKVRTKGGEETEYRIVGVDEMDIDRNWVSWRSPIARALLNAQVGERVRFRFPAGEEELEIVSVNYE